jgi:FtsH-binding integral membrane protein
MAEQIPLLPGAQLLTDAAQDVRAGFVCKVYGILAAQLSLSLLVALPFQTMDLAAFHRKGLLLGGALLVVVAVATPIYCYGSRQYMKQFPRNYLLMSVLTLAMGVVIGLISATYTWQSVALSAAVTAVAMFGMSVVAWVTSMSATGTKPYWILAFLCLSAFGLVLYVIFVSGVTIRWGVIFFDVCCVLPLAFYIMRDTQQMILGDHQEPFRIDDYCFAALDVYLDILNVFFRLLFLFGSRKD